MSSVTVCFSGAAFTFGGADCAGFFVSAFLVFTLITSSTGLLDSDGSGGVEGAGEFFGSLESEAESFCSFLGIAIA